MKVAFLGRAEARGEPKELFKATINVFIVLVIAQPVIAQLHRVQKEVIFLFVKSLVSFVTSITIHLAAASDAGNGGWIGASGFELWAFAGLAKFQR